MILVTTQNAQVPVTSSALQNVSTHFVDTFYISDPAISLTNESSFSSFLCMLRMYCLLHMNTGKLLFHFLCYDFS